VTPAQQYARDLLTEEFGEALQGIGKAGRFGIDTPGVKDALTGVVDLSITPRTVLERELGDVMAAIDYAGAAGLVDRSVVEQRRVAKLQRLLDPTSLDNLGRRLAPDPAQPPVAAADVRP
jgi:hypothetical protein